MATIPSPSYHKLDLQERQAFLEEETSYDDWGSTLKTIGLILILASLVAAVFAGRDVRDGTHFFLRWLVIEAAAGLALIAAGQAMNRRAHTKDDA